MTVILPEVERELMRAARRPVAEPESTPRRLTGVLLAAAVALVAVVIGVGFLVALRGTGNGAAGRGGQAPTTPPVDRSRAAFPGAPHSTPIRFRNSEVVCARVAPNRYLPRAAGCVTVLHVDMAGDGTDLVLLYGDLGSQRIQGDYVPTGYTLEVVRPGGVVARTPVSSEPFPWISRVGNLNDLPGAELVLHLDDISSGDTYGIYTFARGRPRLVQLFSAGGDSAGKEGFACETTAQPRRVTASTMELIGPGIDGNWRWTVTREEWRGSRLVPASHRTFVRRGLPGARDTPIGVGCGRPTGDTQSDPN